MKRRLSLSVTIFVVISLFFTLTVSAGSQSIRQNDQTVVRAFLVLDGVQREISLEDLQEIKRNVGKIEANKTIDVSSQNKETNLENFANDDAAINALIELYDYEEYGFIRNVYRWDLRRRISSPVFNSSYTVANSYSISFSTTQSYESNYQFSTSGERNAITAGVTVGSSWSNSYSVSQTINQEIPPRKYGWMDYTPIMDNSYGLLYEEVWSFDPVSGSNVKIYDDVHYIDLYIAKKTSTNMPDGLYEIVESSSYPYY